MIIQGNRIKETCPVRDAMTLRDVKSESDQRLLHVVAEMPVLMIAFDAQQTIAAWNPECERVTGFSAAEMIGSADAIGRLYPSESTQSLFRNTWFLGADSLRDWEVRTACKRGGERIIAWTRGSDRFRIPGWTTWGVGIDVTEQRNAEQSLARSERDYRGLFDNAHDAIMIFRPDDEVVLEANPHACELYGLSNDEFIGMSLRDISDDVDRGQDRIAQTLASGSNLGFETIQYRKDGSAMLLEVNASLIEYRGEPAILTINRDITKRRSAELNLRNSNARYRWLADHSTDIILRISVDGTILDVSHASRGVLGYAPDDLVGMQCADLVTSEFLTSFAESIHHARTHAGSSRLAVQFKSASGGETWLECQIEGLRTPDSADVREIVIVARDVNLRRQEEELREMRSMELSHVNRLVTLGEMAGQIAHQLHQPLTAIANYAGTMRNLLRKANKQELRELEPICDEIIRSAMRTGEFIHRIRSFTQRRGLRQSATQLKTIVANAFSLCEIRLQRMSVHTSYYEATDLPEIVVDTIQIEQVLVNLINNAIDAMTTRDHGHRRLSITAHVETALQVVICIRDTGVGMAENGEQSLLQPFYTTKPDGVGMGLVISRRIVEAHGGKLWIKSRPDEGTSVFFTLSIGEIDDANE